MTKIEKDKIEQLRKHVESFKDLSDTDILDMYNRIIQTPKYQEARKIASFLIRQTILQ